MKTLTRSLLSLLFLVCLLAGVSAALLYPISRQWHVALIRVTDTTLPAAAPPASSSSPSAPPSPSAEAKDPNAPAVPQFSVQHQVVDVTNGQLRIARYNADAEGPVRLNLPGAAVSDIPALLAGLNLRHGPAEQSFAPTTFWSRGPGDAFVLRLPLIWIAAIGLSVAIVGYGSRTLYRLFTTERKPSAVCLHCNQRYEDFDATECPGCGATRSRVTVTKVGRPL